MLLLLPSTPSAPATPLPPPHECSECCGGMGFLALNRIGPMLNDMNVDW